MTVVYCLDLSALCALEEGEEAIVWTSSERAASKVAALGLSLMRGYLEALASWRVNVRDAEVEEVEDSMPEAPVLAYQGHRWTLEPWGCYPGQVVRLERVELARLPRRALALACLDPETHGGFFSRREVATEWPVPLPGDLPSPCS